MSLGQLGVTPAELETKLGEILDLCSKWDALILLDEADIFLEKRSSTGSLERNAMVSVMLKLVEYFSGILFTMFYPLIMTIVCFWFLGMELRVTIFFEFLLLAVLVNLVGCSLGFFIGVAVDNINSGRTIV